MNKNECIAMGDQYLMHTYNRYKIVLEKGDGVHLYDNEGKKYLDFTAGIAVFALGYNNKKYNDALKNQIDKLIHTSNLYYSEPTVFAAKKICEASGMEKVFFTNSGAEAIEGAIKIARKYSYKKDGKTNHEIIAMNKSFHGRSTGALSVTGNPKYQEAFRPLLPGIKFADFNDLKSVENLVNKKTCAIILEPIQGEGGITPATKEFISGIKKICDEKDILLIFDEIQCGMGRTGTMFAYEQYGVKPDIITVAKALGCGVPVGAFLTSGKTSAVLEPGDHGTTYGGNPFVTSAISIVLDLFEHYDILSNVKKVGDYFEERLENLKKNHSCIKEYRGIGLMWGLEFYNPVSDIILKAMDEGLIIINAGPNVLRFVPPLVITKKDVDDMIDILDRIIE